MFWPFPFLEHTTQNKCLKRIKLIEKTVIYFLSYHEILIIILWLEFNSYLEFIASASSVVTLCVNVWCFLNEGI